MKLCPNCNAQIADDSRFCTECGKEIPQGTVCSHCGASINENDSFCPNCGKNLKETSTIEQIVYNEEQPKNGFKKYLPYIIGAFVFLGIIGYFSSNDSSNQNNSTNAVVADSTSTEIEASVGQLAKEQITKRLKEIFDDVVKGNTNDYDERYFSSDFNRIYNEVAEIDILPTKHSALAMDSRLGLMVVGECMQRVTLLVLFPSFTLIPKVPCLDMVAVNTQKVE